MYKINEWGYNKVEKGAGTFGTDLHLGYGVVTCDCGNRINIHNGGESHCYKCGLHCKREKGKVIVWF